MSLSHVQMHKFRVDCKDIDIIEYCAFNYDTEESDRNKTIDEEFAEKLEKVWLEVVRLEANKFIDNYVKHIDLYDRFEDNGRLLGISIENFTEADSDIKVKYTISIPGKKKDSDSGYISLSLMVLLDKDTKEFKEYIKDECCYWIITNTCRKYFNETGTYYTILWERWNMNNIMSGSYNIRYLEDELYNENLHREIQLFCGGRIQMTIIDRYLFDYYAANRDEYRNKDIEYEVYRINCNYIVISVNVSNNDENTVRVDYMFSIEPYLSNNKKLFPLSVSAIFDKSSGEFVRFEYSPPEVIYRDDLVLKKED